MNRISSMMNSSNGFTGVPLSTGMLGSGNATIMSGTALHQSLNGDPGVPPSATVPGLGVGTMMGGLIQDVLNGNDSSSGIAPSVAQTMLDIMDDMPGIHLVGLAPMGLDYFTVQA